MHSLSFGQKNLRFPVKFPRLICETIIHKHERHEHFSKQTSKLHFRRRKCRTRPYVLLIIQNGRCTTRRFDTKWWNPAKKGCFFWLPGPSPLQKSSGVSVFLGACPVLYSFCVFRERAPGHFLQNQFFLEIFILFQKVRFLDLLGFR